MSSTSRLAYTSETSRNSAGFAVSMKAAAYRAGAREAAERRAASAERKAELRAATLWAEWTAAGADVGMVETEDWVHSFSMQDGAGFSEDEFGALVLVCMDQVVKTWHMTY